MGKVMKTVLLLIFCSLVVGAPSVYAYWIPDGVPICAAVGAQQSPTIISDPRGEVIVAWADQRSGDADIYAQRMNVLGVTEWASDGVAICAAAGHQMSPASVPDIEGGAIVAWVDYRNGIDYDVYAQRVDESGAVRWTTNGVALCAQPGGQLFPAAVSDGFGGAIVAWQDERGGNLDIYAQRVDASGAVRWTTNGVAICAAAGAQQHPKIAADGAGGAIIVWYDDRSGTNDIYAQRVDASGGIRWKGDGTPVCAAAGAQWFPMIVSDGFAGALITWYDDRSGTNDIYCERVNADGVSQWTANGVALCAAAGNQQDPKIISDGAGGATVTWYDDRSGGNDIYAQRVDAAGAVQWSSDGIVISAAPFSQQAPAIASDGSGGAIVAWQDWRAAKSEIYAQRVDISGSVQWTVNGIPLCTAAGNRGYAAVVSDGEGGAVAVWNDFRSGDADIYSQLVDRHGRVGSIVPVIASVRDVPGDQGGNVFLSWWAARLDVYTDVTMSHYSIWRAMSVTKAAEDGGGEGSVIESLPELDGGTGARIVRSEKVGPLTYVWELVETIDAACREAYGMPVATLFDSTAVYSKRHYFQIIAHTTDPKIFWESEPDSGRSVDNLTPSPPLGLGGAQSSAPAGLNLTWSRNVEADLDRYRVYRGLDENFIPGIQNLIASSCDTACFDGGWRSSTEYFYKVSAVDVHGNESGCALLKPSDIDGVREMGTPLMSTLAQNFPNPFNPTTKIEFELVEPTKVGLRIYDAAGHLVKVLVDERLPAARHQRTWDGRDDAGRQVASGIYFYRLEAGAFESTRKMILVR